MTQERTTYVGGKLDEIVVAGSAQLEHMGGRHWFLSMVRADGTETAIWLTGYIDRIEERPAPERATP